MAARYYSVQWCHSKRGWLDLASLASLKKKEAEDASEEFALRWKVATRVIRKPHGWTPPRQWGVEGPAKFVLDTGRTIDVVLEQRGDWVAHEVGRTMVWATNLGPMWPEGWGNGTTRDRVVKVIQDDNAPRGTDR
jgi:hypothetical protein